MTDKTTRGFRIMCVLDVLSAAGGASLPTMTIADRAGWPRSDTLRALAALGVRGLIEGSTDRGWSANARGLAWPRTIEIPQLPGMDTLNAIALPSAVRSSASPPSASDGSDTPRRWGRRAAACA